MNLKICSLNRLRNLWPFEDQLRGKRRYLAKGSYNPHTPTPVFHHDGLWGRGWHAWKNVYCFKQDRSSRTKVL